MHDGVRGGAGDGPATGYATLGNGLRVVASPMPHARSAAISIYLGAGARHEADPADAGLSHFVEHLCFKGTERRPSPRAVAVEIDALGGAVNAATDRELTVYYARVTADRAAQALDLLTDAVRRSLFRDEEIERERRVILEELAAVEDAPDEQASLALDGLLWPDEPLGRDVAGTPDSVRGIGAERLRAYWRGQYVANAAVIAVAGAVEPQRVFGLVEEAAGDWAAGEPSAQLPAGDAPRGERVRLVTKETEQAYVSLGVRALDARDEDRYALGLLSVVLGEGMSSRLFLRLREELGLCYDVHSATAYLRDTGALSVHASVDPGAAAEAVREIASALARIREPIGADELARAKRLVRARIALQLEDTRAVSAWYGSRLALGLPLREPEEAIASFEAVTAADAERVARRLLRTERLQLAAVGPLAAAAPAIEAALRLEA